ncbi:MAG: metallophosphoesterase [Chloroflexi bacterium]|nr:metallophosphoesterase family protein [Chloroflexota bacterium]MQC26862.1 metallophosphoesterase [Chloroflexota bacterium]
MRVAMLSDIHGNSIALDAVLADIAVQGPIDEYWLLGDYAAIGFDPVGCLERVAVLPNAVFTRGNTDRYLVESLALDAEFDGFDTEKARAIAELHISFAWTQGYLRAIPKWLDWLKSLPLEHRVTLPDGTRFLGVHSSPGSDDSSGLHPELSKEALRKLFGEAEADIVCVGHTHYHMEANVDGIRLINLGSVSNPFPPELRASYVLLEANEEATKLEHYFVEYDHEAVIEATAKIDHPEIERITRFMRGEVKAGWMR